jgi:hypothetical protein
MGATYPKTEKARMNFSNFKFLQKYKFYFVIILNLGACNNNSVVKEFKCFLVIT